MAKIQWLSKEDEFVLDRDTLCNLIDWVSNIYLFHHTEYDLEDIKSLKILVKEIDKSLLSYASPHKLKKKLNVEEIEDSEMDTK